MLPKNSTLRSPVWKDPPSDRRFRMAVTSYTSRGSKVIRELTGMWEDGVESFTISSLYARFEGRYTVYRRFTRKWLERFLVRILPHARLERENRSSPIQRSHSTGPVRYRFVR
ncbi:MAG: hypothetical protein LN413_00365 [Candidatus Thermoplasmatota archaeon]|nr:hypothetical protein [Candidatus Thermoplasmatota archaeon]